MRDPGNTQFASGSRLANAHTRKMKTAVLLVAAIAVATAFDFPEEWEAWKVVSPAGGVIGVRSGGCNLLVLWL